MSERTMQQAKHYILDILKGECVSAGAYGFIQEKLNEMCEEETCESMMKIYDSDIATIEALHDTLLDEKVLGFNARCMRESRELTNRMYQVLYDTTF